MSLNQGTVVITNKCEVERCWLRSLSPLRLSIVLTKLGYGANTINPLSCWLMESGGMLGLAARWRHATRPRGTSVAATPSLKTRNRFVWQYFPHRQAGPVCWANTVHSINTSFNTNSTTFHPKFKLKNLLIIRINIHYGILYSLLRYSRPIKILFKSLKILKDDFAVFPVLM